MQFDVRTEKEIKDSSLWPEDEYPFEVLDAEEKDSSNKNRMIELKLKVINDNDGSKTVYDYLMPQTPAKLKHAAEACGLAAKYKSGSLKDSDFVGKTGWLKLGRQRATKQYQARNVVADYVAKENSDDLADVVARYTK